MKKILSSSLSLPVAFTFNIRRTVYDTFGLGHFELAKKHLGCTLIPVITEQDSRIQQRARLLKSSLQRLLQTSKHKRLHLVSYCASGLDSRYAVSQLNMSECVPTLTTICTPHKGSRLAKMYDHKGLEEKVMYPIARAAGLGCRSFTELVPDNIQGFNEVVINSPNTAYFSMGAEKTPQYCSEIYKYTCNMLRTTTLLNFAYENDGVYGYDEINWGKHLVNFEYDHSQVIGIGGGFRGETFKLILENLKYQEAVLRFKQQEKPKAKPQAA